MKYLRKFEAYLTDEEIEESYTDWRLNERDFRMDTERSGMVVLEQDYIEGCDDCPTEMVDNFIIYDNGRIGFENWYPDSLSSKIIIFIQQKLPEDNKYKKLLREVYDDLFVKSDSDRFGL